MRKVGREQTHAVLTQPTIPLVVLGGRKCSEAVLKHSVLASVIK